MTPESCDCGHPIDVFFAEGEELPDEYECPICGEVYEVSEWAYIQEDAP